MKPYQEFQMMNAEAGIEMTAREAKVNYAACMTALSALTEGHCSSIDEAVDAVQEIAHKEFNPGLCRKFLKEALPIWDELKIEEVEEMENE